MLQTKQLHLTSAPANNSTISTKVFAISGENYRVLNTFTGDGSTTSFLTSTRGEFNLDSTSSDIYVTVDGVPTTAYTTTTSANTITVVFNTAPNGKFLHTDSRIQQVNNIYKKFCKCEKRSNNI